MEEAVECIGPLGTAAIVGVPPGGKNLKIDPLLFLLENKKLVGVIEGDSNPQEFIPQLIEMHQAGHFPVDKLCKTYPISKFEDALADIKSGKV
jgi:Zn-dependent alcohol dehydrogenase